MCAAAVVALACVNAFGRLGSETVTEWDESLYATSAAEMVSSGNWISTTFYGVLDYSNSKPPLNVWLIALSFKAFGQNIVALRVPSATATVLTVILLITWLRRAYSDELALTAGLVLATSFAAFYVHSGRTANPDALFTLLILSTVVTVWSASEVPTSFPLVGVFVAAAFLLRGFGALLLVAVASIGALIRLRQVLTARLVIAAVAISAMVVAPWAAARWSVDGVKFFQLMFLQDALNRTVSNLDAHPGSILFYLDVLQRYQYDWIAAAVVVLLLHPPSLTQTNAWLRRRNWLSPSPLIAASGTTLLVVPSMMQTKATWYGNPLLPFLAMMVGAAIVHAFGATTGNRRRLVVAVVAIVAVTAESRLVWHSFNRRDLARSDQGLLLAEKRVLAGHRVYRDHWTRADNFVVDHLIGATHMLAPDVAHFIADSESGDFFLVRGAVQNPSLDGVSNNSRYFLYRRN